MVLAVQKITFRKALAVTVACGMVLSGCANKDKDREHTKIDPKQLHAPIYNPSLVNGQVSPREGARAPEANEGMGTGSRYQLKNQPSSPDQAQAQRQESQPEGGMFDWLLKDSSKETAKKPMAKSQPHTAGQPLPAARKRPALNAQGIEDGDAMLAPATFGAVATPDVAVMDAPPAVRRAEPSIVESTDAQPELFASENHSFAHGNSVPAPVKESKTVSSPKAQRKVEPQPEFIPVEETETIVIPAKKDYPALSTVPPRPERLKAVEERDDKFIELEKEYDKTIDSGKKLDEQLSHDDKVSAIDSGDSSFTPTSMAQDGYAGLHNYGEEVRILPEQKADVAAVKTKSSQSMPELVTFAADGQELSEETPAQIEREQIAAAEQAMPVAGQPSSGPHAWQSAAAKQAGAAAPFYEEAPAAEVIPIVEENTKAVEVQPEEELVPVVAPKQSTPAHTAHAASAAATPVIMGSPPGYLKAPESRANTHVTSVDAVTPQTEVVADTNEWVDVQGNPIELGNGSIENVDVAVVPETGNVALSPDALTLTPPSAAGSRTRVLPDSRYAARRQAIYSQQYSRRTAVDNVN